MARDIIKYITYAPKTESTWNTPEEKKQEKERVIEHASKEMVKSLINRNKKTLKFDYRGIYYNGKLGLIIIGRIPENAQEENYKDYTTLFDIDTASDPENIKEIIKEYLKENNLGGVIFKLTEEGTKPKGLYDQLHRQLREGESELFFSGAIDRITTKYDWIKTALDIELEPDDELINGTYTIEYSEAGDEVTGILHITALSKQGVLYTAQGKMAGNKDSETESFTEKSSNKIKLVSEGKTLKPFQWDWETRSPKDIAEKVKDFIGEDKKFTYSGSLLGDELDKVKAFLQLDTEEVVNGNYVVSFDLSEEDKLSYKGNIVLELKDGSKKVYSEKLQSVDVTSEETTLFSSMLTTIPTPAPKIFDPKTLKTPKSIFDTLDALRNGDKFFSSGVLDTHEDIKRLISELELTNEAEGLTSKSEQYTRATWDLMYTRDNASDTLSYEMNIYLETTLGQRRLIIVKYRDQSKDKDDTTSRVLSKELHPRLLRATIDPMIDAFSPSDLTRALKKHYPMATEYPIEFSGVILDTDRMTDLAQYYPDTQTNVVNPLALVYDIEYKQTGIDQMSGKVRLTWFLESGKRVKLTGEYENVATSLATPGDNLKNREIKILDVSSSGDGKQIMDYRYTVEVNTSPEALKARYTPYLKTGENRAYLEGVVTDPSVLSGLSRVFGRYVTTGSFDPIALFYEITYSPNGDSMISWREATHILLKDGRQLRVQRQYQNEDVTSYNAPSEQFEIIASPSGGLTPEQIEKIENLEQIVKKIENTNNITEDKRLTESISVGGEVLLETYKGELKDGPKKYYSLNVGHNLGHHIIERKVGYDITVPLDTSKYNVFRRDGELFLPMDLYKRSLNGDGLFYGRVLDRFAKDLNGANNIRTQDAFRFDTDTGFPELNVVGTSGTLDTHELLFAVMIPNGGSVVMLDPQELGIGVAGKEIISPMTDGVMYESLYIRNAAEPLQEFAIFKVTFTDKEKFKKLMETVYLEEAGKCFGMVYNKAAYGTILGDRLPNLGPTNSYPIHKTTFGAIVGSNDKRNKLSIQYLEASEGLRTNDLSKIKDLYESSFLVLLGKQKGLKHPRTIGGTPYLYTEGNKDEEKNPLGIVGVIFNQTEVHNTTGYYIKEYVNQEILPNLGLTESNLTAELVEFGYEKQNGSQGEESDSPIIVITFDISSNGTKIGRIKMRQTMEVVKQYYVRTSKDLGIFT